jgi:hypothetical protein
MPGLARSRKIRRTSRRDYRFYGSRWRRTNPHSIRLSRAPLALSHESRRLVRRIVRFPARLARTAPRVPRIPPTCSAVRSVSCWTRTHCPRSPTNPADLLGGSFGFLLDPRAPLALSHESRRLARRIVRFPARPRAHHSRSPTNPADLLGGLFGFILFPC